MTDTRIWEGSPFSDDEVRARIASSQEIGSLDFITRGGFSQETAYYLSFADADLPKGSQWLGGCYIRGESTDEVLVLSRVLEINPGGEVQIAGPFPARALVEEYEHRLLTTHELINSGVDESKL